ncbi:MAG: divalent metal cation transporter [Planctomycetales bacterium]|nr:divalent metal cation transporter [Planctomycetales bacterium]
MSETTKVYEDRQILLDAQQRGGVSVLGAFVKLSGPGWLQSAITLGGGSLSGALFLGVLGGTSMLWLQLVAIIMGVIMLSAISYVTLSTGKRPFQAINEYINPVLGCGWLLATCAANVIWIMPQFSLSYDALSKNLISGLADETQPKLIVSFILFALAFALVILNTRGGPAAKLFDWFLKALVGMVVICFFGVVVYLFMKSGLPINAIVEGFIPNLNQWNEPTGIVADILSRVSADAQAFWRHRIISQQRDVMIGAAATAVGINMTFLLPYSMLARGWDKPFRGLARFDLSTGMAIPYIVVTSCVVIAASASFHGQADEALLSTDPAVMQTSSIFKGARQDLEARVQMDMEGDAWVSASEVERIDAIAKLSEDDKLLASTLVKRNAFQLSQSLEPLLGAQLANIVFGLGVLGMGFSTIIILMLINGYVFRELAPESMRDVAHIVGCIVAGVSGVIWPYVWAKPDQQVWLGIVASTFGAMLLPVAYITFLFMMNSRRLMGEEKPTGIVMAIWNVLMGASVLGALVAAGSSMWQKAQDPTAGPVVIAIACFFIAMVVVGFAARPIHPSVDSD